MVTITPRQSLYYKEFPPSIRWHPIDTVTSFTSDLARFFVTTGVSHLIMPIPNGKIGVILKPEEVTEIVGNNQHVIINKQTQYVTVTSTRVKNRVEITMRGGVTIIVTKGKVMAQFRSEITELKGDASVSLFNGFIIIEIKPKREYIVRLTA